MPLIHKVLLAFAGTAAYIGCSAPTPAVQKTAPAKITGATEAELSTVTLSAEAEQRLGVRLLEVTREPMRQSRTYGAEVLVPPGRSAAVVAPFTGTLQPPANTPPIAPGSQIRQHQPIYDLQVVLSPPDRLRLAELLLSLFGTRLEADAQLERARLQRDAAKLALNRAELLVRDKAGSVKAKEEAGAQFEIAQAALQAAEARRTLLSQTMLEAEAGSVKTYRIEAPATGVVREMRAMAGQTVAAGAVLLELATLDVVWIRVPVYVGELAQVDPAAPALVAEFSTHEPAQRRPAVPVQAPPSARVESATVDLFYQLDNPDGSLRPGQKLAAVVALRHDEPQLVVPWSAVVHDFHGGQWVYESPAPHRFVRRRVEVAHLVDGRAVLARGPAAGTQVVVEAAAELFGTEFGFGK